MHGALDLPVRGRHPRQQIRAKPFGLPLPHRADMHTYALLLGARIHRRQAGIRRGPDQRRHLSGVR